MAYTKTLRDQHAELKEMTRAISSGIDQAGMTKELASIRKPLLAMAGKLNVHLAMEDNSLYPSLLTSGDAKLEETARRFVEEMGGLKQGFEEYLKRWSGRQAIESDMQGFVAASKDLFAALHERIEREETELYPLVEDLQEERPGSRS